MVESETREFQTWTAELQKARPPCCFSFEDGDEKGSFIRRRAQRPRRDKFSQVLRSSASDDLKRRESQSQGIEPRPFCLPAQPCLFARPNRLAKQRVCVSWSAKLTFSGGVFSLAPVADDMHQTVTHGWCFDGSLISPTQHVAHILYRCPSNSCVVAFCALFCLEQVGSRTVQSPTVARYLDDATYPDTDRPVPSTSCILSIFLLLQF